MDDIRVSAFLGSPRKEGNTEIIFNNAVSSIEESGTRVTKFNLCEMKINPCIDCGDCGDTGICTIEDDMTEIYEAIRSSNRFILASPIFFYGLSAQAKAMVDRCQSFWCEKYLMKKTLSRESDKRKGLLLMVGGMKNDIGENCCSASAKAFFRTISVDEQENLIFKGIDSKGAILKHPDKISEVQKSAKALIE